VGSCSGAKAIQVSGGDAFGAHEPQLPAPRCGAHRHQLHQRLSGPRDHDLISIEGLFNVPGEVGLGVVEIHMHQISLAGLVAKSVGSSGFHVLPLEPQIAVVAWFLADVAIARQRVDIDAI